MRNNKFFLLFIVMLIGFGISINAQDLLETLEKEYPDIPQYEIATFKSTRIAIGHSIENRKEGVLQVMAMNRYWNIPNYQGQSFIADKWSARIALEYGISNRLSTGIGWTTLEDVYDGFLKYNLLRQRKKSKNSFVSVTLFQNASYRSESEGRSAIYGGFEDTSFSDRLAFTTQVLIARKFTPQFSAQISPTFIHRGSSLSDEDPNNHFAIGIGGRYKVGGHVSIVSEYYYVANPIKSVDTYGAFALGVNWELSDLMLQFHMTNAWSTVEDVFITQTPNNFNLQDGNFTFGFTATFALHLKQKQP
ncbi:hypothetical protein J8L88_04380 [Aquimarina sp. MMG015]|uniref:DUF5777 family beta-barrel protein n=1 Tax=Aquimarina sp. MMG015 TaxID=2822689 RepID=UPI001B3A4697|nr:DUF5777 family beta-barrel protein [Aquimarina sp. MMG015]MBQ4802081.1 hypothetical protein [Aquimarina sp. MMG015]